MTEDTRPDQYADDEPIDVDPDESEKRPVIPRNDTFGVDGESAKLYDVTIRRNQFKDNRREVVFNVLVSDAEEGSVFVTHGESIEPKSKSKAFDWLEKLGVSDAKARVKSGQLSRGDIVRELGIEGNNYLPVVCEITYRDGKFPADHAERPGETWEKNYIKDLYKFQ